MRLGADQSDSDDDLLDVQHSSITNNRSTPQTRVIDPSDDTLLDGSGSPMDPTVQGDLKFRYHYPALRFSNIFRVVVFLGALLTIVLWLTGGDTDYFVHNIKHYALELSVFDLAVISFVLCPVYLLLIYKMEKICILSMDHSHHNLILISKLKILRVMILFISLVTVVFSVAKGSLVLHRLVDDNNYTGMHPEYYACIICHIVFSLVTLVLSVISGLCLRRLEKFRVKKLYNRQGQEVNSDGSALVREASLQRLMSLAKPELPFILGGSSMLLVSSGVQVVGPLFFGKVVDAALESMDKLNQTVIILTLIYVLGAITSWIRSWLFVLAGQRLVARLRTRLFASVIKQEIAFFDTNRTGELCNRLASDTQVLQNALTVNVSMLLRYLLQILGSLGLMFFLNAKLTGVLLAVVPVVSIAAVQYGKFVRKVRKEFQDKLAEAGTQAEESLSSVRTVRSFAGENKAMALYGGTVWDSYELGKKLALAEGIMAGVFSFLGYGAVVAVLWYGGKLVNDNKNDPNVGITAGLLTSFLLYTLQVAMGFALLSSLYGDFMQAVGASARIFTLLDRKSDMFAPLRPLVLPALSGEIEFKNIWFRYPSRPENDVLKGISFTVEPGQTVALVGPSGGGKSTIVSLIERFYDPNQGSIRFGGVELRLLDQTWLRQKVSMVGQEPTLFAYSIRENIAYGRGATDEEVEQAARQANAHNFIMSFEEGYQTKVGERGVRLSGGQKQRIAIARALIMNPALLLLDEATSALDAESEHLVQEAIDRAMEQRTVIVIAHRLSTVRNAHKVIVIDNGSIAEMGTHSELLALNGVYKRLVLRQLTSGDDSNGLTDQDSKPEEQSQRFDVTGGHLDLQNDENIGGKDSFVNKGESLECSQSETSGAEFKSHMTNEEKSDLNKESKVEEGNIREEVIGYQASYDNDSFQEEQNRV